MNSSAIKWQVLKYGIVGLMSNLVLYLCYLGLTALGTGHKSAMTLLYVIGVMQTFYFNRGWTFSHDGHVTSAFVRYVITYALGYGLNLATLLLLVDVWGWPHQVVQGVTILVLAGILFLLQRYWVFPESRAVPRQESQTQEP